MKSATITAALHSKGRRKKNKESLVFNLTLKSQMFKLQWRLWYGRTKEKLLLSLGNTHRESEIVSEEPTAKMLQSLYVWEVQLCHLGAVSEVLVSSLSLPPPPM